MILRAISSLMATRDSLILTMMFPPIAATTVAVPPGVKPEVLEVLAQLRTPTDSEDQIFLADIGKCKRHHGIPSPFFG